MRYRKKPVEIEAIQYEGGRNLNEVYAWIAATAGVDAAYVAADGGFMIRTLEGEHRADPAD